MSSSSSTAVKVLFVLTSDSSALWPSGGKTGYWWSELAHPFHIFKKAGYSMDICSPSGTAAVDAGSVGDDFLDEYTKAQWKDAKSDVHTLLGRMVRASDVDAKSYNVVFYVGGHGTLYDFPNTKSIQDLGANVYERGGVVGAVCHGPAILGGLKLSNGSYLVNGKKATGFSATGESTIGLTARLSELKLSNTPDLITKGGGSYEEGPTAPFDPHVVTDGRLVTGKNPSSASGSALAIVKILSPGLDVSESKAPRESKSLFETIDAGNRAFEVAFNSKDGTAVSNLYTKDDAKLFPPGQGGATFEGRTKISAFWDGGIGAGLRPLALKTGTVTQHGDVLIENSTYTHAKGSGAYMVIWKQEEGHWRLWRDIFNA